MGGRTVTMTFQAKAGNHLRLAYGYWDPDMLNEETGKTGMWIHNDDTQLGEHQFDENGEISLTFTIPDKAKSVEIMIYNYMDKSSGTTVQLDKAEVALGAVVLTP